MNLFVYGSLRHEPLLRIVLGKGPGQFSPVAAQLSDHAVAWASGDVFPICVEAPGAQAPGLLIRGLGDSEMARVTLFEGEEDYTLETVLVETVDGPEEARVFMMTPGRWQAGAPWDFDDWRARFAAFSCNVAAEMMEGADHWTPSDIDRLYPSMAARAAARTIAGAETPRLTPSGLDRSDVELRNVRRPFTGFFAMEETETRFRRYDGTWSDWVPRAVLVATDASIVLPYDPVRDRVLLIEQVRAGPMARGDKAPWALEPIAGRIDPGETPEDCAMREAIEEAGVALTHLEVVSRSYPTPGSASEFFHVYVGLADLPDEHAKFGGLAEEAEDIAIHLMDLDAALDLADRDQLTVLPTVLALNWLARHRDRLRANA